MNVSVSQRISVPIAIALAICLLSDCRDTIGDGTAAEFMRRSIPERRATIRQYSVDRQLDLYVLAMMRSHPPDLGLADEVAGNGADLVPILIRRIVDDDREVAK